MSIEAAMAELTAALTRNSDLLETITKTASSNMQKNAAAPTEEDTPKAAKAEKPAKTAAKPAAVKPPKVPTPAEMASATTSFLEVEDEDEYNTRRALVKAIVSANGVKKMSEIPEDGRQKALDALVAHKAGEPTGFEDDEDVA